MKAYENEIQDQEKSMPIGIFGLNYVKDVNININRESVIRTIPIPDFIIL